MMEILLENLRTFWMIIKKWISRIMGSSFCQELMYENRSFLNKSLGYRYGFYELLVSVLDDFSKNFCIEPVFMQMMLFLRWDKMGAPPKRLVRHGKSKSYWYTFIYIFWI